MLEELAKEHISKIKQAINEYSAKIRELAEQQAEFEKYRNELLKEESKWHKALENN